MNVIDVMKAVEDFATEELPIPKSKPKPSSKTETVAGWCEMVKPFRDTVYFWHQVWISAGRPINTELHKIMKRTRNVYHFHVRKCKKAEKIISRNKPLDACINGSSNILV